MHTPASKFCFQLLRCLRFAVRLIIFFVDICKNVWFITSMLLQVKNFR
jgi:hypothetical protein